MNLTEKTEKLKEELIRLKNRYENTPPPENRRDREFFEMVKKETSSAYSLLEIWEEEALQIVKERKANVHPQQVVSTKENMELLLMHSYFIDARKNRYMELYRSSLYVFDQLLDDLNKIERNEEVR